ncbi:MAG: hypothetical protein R3E39_06520 [Anaerolineae bacterium]
MDDVDNFFEAGYLHLPQLIQLLDNFVFYEIPSTISDSRGMVIRKYNHHRVRIFSDPQEIDEQQYLFVYH